ncbi:MAG: tetratricopeptide repeat protein [Planctomycetes bacterium]|nr:tetratricopeptide repeat protein [Planctomycetota bacterium]
MSNRSRLKKLVFAIVATIAFFLILEIGLGLCGITPVTETHDPFVGFSQIPLLESVTGESDEELLTTASSKLVWFNEQTFPKHKPAGSRRVFCVGGSTTYGRPYWDATSYSGFLRELLPLVDDSCEWEVINAGGVSYASYRVAAVVEELARYEPDLFIVYSVHNEFLERRTYEGMFEQPEVQLRISSALSQTRTWALLARVLKRHDNDAPIDASTMFAEEVNEILNDTVGPSDYHRDDEWREGVLRHYELNLQRMVKAAKQAGAKIVVVTPASNQKDCSPFKSEPQLGLSGNELTQLQSHLALAEEQLANEQLDDALLSIEQAKAMDDGYAAMHYLNGKTQFALGRTDVAKEAFDRALIEDICPLRALPEITETIRRVAARERVPVVDFGNRLLAKCEDDFGHPCIGTEYFLDHVHPTIDVHRQLALWIIETLQREEIIGGSSPSSAAISSVAERIDARIDRTEQGVALRNLAKVLHWAGKFDEAAPRAADALALLEDDLESQFLLAECLRLTRRNSEAMIEFEQLFDIEPNYHRGYIPFGVLLVEESHLTAAKIYLAMGIALYPNRDDAHQALGAAHLQMAEYELATQSLLEASLLNPYEPDTLLLLARTRLATGEANEAVSLYKQAIRLGRNGADTNNELGEALLRAGRVKAALAHFLNALSIEPGHEGAQLNFDSVRKDLGL